MTAFLARANMNFGSIITEITTAVVYWRFAHIAATPMCFGVSCQTPPLTIYANKFFYVMRTVPRAQIVQMLKEIFEQISFSGSLLHPCAVGIRSQRGRAG